MRYGGASAAGGGALLFAACCAVAGRWGQAGAVGAGAVCSVKRSSTQAVDSVAKFTRPRTPRSGRLQDQTAQRLDRSRWRNVENREGCHGQGRAGGGALGRRGLRAAFDAAPAIRRSPPPLPDLARAEHSMLPQRCLDRAGRRGRVPGCIRSAMIVRQRSSHKADDI